LSVRSKSRVGQLATFWLVLVCAFGPEFVHARSEAPAAEEEPPALETITVRAQRRDEDIQDVPIAVTALDEAFLRRHDVQTLEDLSGFVPNLYTTQSVNYGAAPLSIRGIGGANGGGNFFNDEPVAVYLDEMYIGRLSFSTSDLVDIESIEVLRGPQGSLFGRNATAGALLVQPARPTESSQGDLRLQVAGHGERRVQGAASGPLNKQLLARIAFGHTDVEGWGRNRFNGEAVNGREDTTVRLSLAWRPSTELAADLMVERSHHQANPATINVAPVAPGVPSSPFLRRDDLDEALDRDAFSFDEPSDNETESSNAVFKLNWAIGEAMLTAITGLRDYELDGRQDSDSTPFTLFNNSGTIAADQLSQELRLSSRDDESLRWTVGAYYYREDTDVVFDIRNVQGLFGAGTEATFDAAQQLESWAVFADARYAFTDEVALTLGGRFSHETKRFDNKQVVSAIGESDPLPVDFGPFPAGTRIPGGTVFLDPPQFFDTADFRRFSPRAVLDYEPRPGLHAYVSYSEGFKSGGFNSFGLSPAFEEEGVEAFEVGVKSTWLQRRLRLNAAGFTYDYSNLQVRLPVPTGGISIENAGAARVRGLELEGSLLLSDRLRLDGSVALLDTELKTFDTQQVPDDLMFLLGAPIPLEPVSAAGNELTRAPKLSFFASLHYGLDLAEDLEGMLELSYRYQDEVFFLETNQDRNTFKGGRAHRLDLRFSIRPYRASWDAAVYVNNLNDDRTITQVTALGAFPNAAISPPRQVGVEFSYRWLSLAN
jgi:iron complex outermembrane receptor protein